MHTKNHNEVICGGHQYDFVAPGTVNAVHIMGISRTYVCTYVIKAENMRIEINVLGARAAPLRRERPVD